MAFGKGKNESPTARLDRIKSASAAGPATQIVKPKLPQNERMAQRERDDAEADAQDARFMRMAIIGSLALLSVAGLFTLPSLLSKAPPQAVAASAKTK